ncbi:MAG: hypothetical protein IT162_22125 [Bryobacterales bacterium]|nr:hypothetical protein [Bryobacterales bacterium]
MAGQRRVDERNQGERIYAVVPLVGAGTPQDPKRPLFVPSPEERQRAAASKTPALTSYSVVLSDDRKFALVEFVAEDPKALEELLKSERADVKRFDLQKGKAKAEDLELEFRKYKKDFDFNKFREGK